MKTQYYAATSLDGFIATEDDSLDWLFPLGDINATSYPSFIAQIGGLAMGSSTCEWMLRHAERVSDETGSPWPYTQPTNEGADIRFAKGDVRPVRAEMARAARDRNIWIVGGGDLAGQFHDANLLDELVVQHEAGMRSTLDDHASSLAERPRIDRLGHHCLDRGAAMSAA